MDSFETYIVKAGDNLWRIAKAFFVDITDIMKVNHMSGPTIQVGQELKIPQKTVDSTPTVTITPETSVSYVTPVDTAPADTAPVDTAPADTTPVDTTPVDTTPVDTTPVDTTPVDTTPVDTTAVDTAPVVEKPATTAQQTIPVHTIPWAPLNTSNPVTVKSGTATVSTDPIDPSKIVQLAKYTIVKGDTFSTIAASHHITLAELLAANPQIITSNLIYPGQVINIPVASDSLVTVYDSVDWLMIPRDAEGIAYYIDGARHFDQGIDLSIFKQLRFTFTITTTGLNTADAIDCEAGDVSVDNLQEALDKSGAAWIYIDRYQWQQKIETLSKLRTTTNNVPKWWVADWTNVPHLVLGADATQWTSETIYDVSLFNVG